MAEDNQVCEEPRGQQHSGPFGFAVAAMTVINRGVAAIFNAATRDGTLAAAFRQGASEIGQALKAFPDSISAQEPGTVLNPTQGEIADARDPDAPTHGMTKSNAGTVHGPPAPSAGEAAKGQATVHGPQQGNGQSQSLASDNGDGQAPTGEKEQKSWVEKERERQGKAGEDGNAGNDQKEEKNVVEQILEQRAKANQDGNAGSDQQGDKGWVEKELERRAKANQDGNAGNDQSDQARGRSLPDEQREKDQDRGRGR